MDPSIGDTCFVDCATTHIILCDKKYFSNLILVQSNVNTISGHVDLNKCSKRATIIVAIPEPGSTRLVSPNRNPRTLVRFLIFTVLFKFSFSKMSGPESPVRPEWRIRTRTRFTPTVFIYLIKTFYLRHFILKFSFTPKHFIMVGL